MKEVRVFGSYFSESKMFRSNNRDDNQVYINSIVIERGKRGCHTQSIMKIVKLRVTN